MTGSEQSLAAPMGLLTGILHTARPRQWVKNLLVFAAPVASGLLFDPGVAWRGVVVFFGFTLMASGVYFFNDSRDVEEDRQHPVKRLRPIAAGVVPVPLGYTLSVVFLLTGMATMASVNADVLIMGVIYVIINIGYSLGLKDLTVVDLLIVALGFMLRAVAGSLAIPDVPTVWFVLMALFGSLLLVSGKRSGERSDLGGDGATRKSLVKYTDSYLVFVRGFAAAGLLMAYGLMAYERAEVTGGPAEVALQVSIVPFVALVMVLVQRMDSGGGSRPEDLILGDRGVQVAALVWLVTFAAGVYLPSTWWWS